MSADPVQTTVADDQDEALFLSRLSGKGEKAVAKLHGVRPTDVRRAVLAHAPSIDHESRTLELQLDLARVNALTSRFYDIAMSPDTEPQLMVAASSIFIRLSERRSTLLGLDVAPTRGLEPVTFAPEPLRSRNSTQKIQDALTWLASTKSCIEGTAVEQQPQPEPEEGSSRH